MSPRRLTYVLFGVILILTALSVVGHGLQYFHGTDRYVQFVRLFNISGEGNIPTWFSSMCLFLSGLLLAAIAKDEASQPNARFVKHWVVLAILFVYMSMDEAAEIHELLNDPLRAMVPTRGLLYQAWVVPAMALVAVVGMAYVRFLRHLPGVTRRLFLVAAALYVGGALGMELLGNYVMDYDANNVLVRGGLATIEDFMEMTGVVVFIHALMTYRSREAGLASLHAAT